MGRSFMTLFNYIIGQFDNAKSIGINYAQSAFYSQAGGGRRSVARCWLCVTEIRRHATAHVLG